MYKLGLFVAALLAFATGVTDAQSLFNYAMMFDPADWQRVAKIFIGEGGGAVASNQPSPQVGSRRAPVRGAAPAVDEAYQEEPYDEAYPEEAVEDFETAEEEIDPDETGEVDESIEAEQPEGQDYLPPPPSFPGAPSPRDWNPRPLEPPQRSSRQQEPLPGPEERHDLPPTTPSPISSGRPIPVPGNPNQPPEQDPQEQQEEEQSQQ